MTTAVSTKTDSYPFLFFIPEEHNWDFLNELIIDAYEDAIDSTAPLGIPTAIDVAQQVEGHYVDILIAKSIHHDDVDWGSSIRPAVMEAIRTNRLDEYKDEMWEIILSAGMTYNDGFGEIMLMDIKLLLDINKLVYSTYDGSSETLSDEMQYEGVVQVYRFLTEEEHVMNIPICEVW